MHREINQKQYMLYTTLIIIVVGYLLLHGYPRVERMDGGFRATATYQRAHSTGYWIQDLNHESDKIYHLSHSLLQFNAFLEKPYQHTGNYRKK